VSGLRRFWTARVDEGTEVVLSSREGRHALAVLRLGRGDRIELIDGSGRIGEAEVTDVDRGGLRARILMTRSAPPDPLPRLTVGVGIAKGKHADLVIRLAAELGARAVWPLVTERTVATPRREESQRVERWKRLAVESLKQSRRTRMTTVERPLTVEEALTRSSEFPSRYLAWLGEKTVPLSRALSRDALGGDVLFLIGPEGDFTTEETKRAQEVGFVPVSLTESVLRVETAVAYVLSVFHGEAAARRERSSPSSPGSLRHG
jgi:16S rRNA (uracil1498-N3)-methyltransferase